MIATHFDWPYPASVGGPARATTRTTLEHTKPKVRQMSVTMNWTTQAGTAPRLYQEFLVPAIFGPFAEDLVDRVGLEPGMRVLDVACGTGALASAAARRVGAAGLVVGVDVSGPMLEIATAHEPERGAAAIEYLEAGAEELPVADSAFDVVFCQQGLQFFADRSAALRAMRSAAAMGGRVAIATWTAPEQAVGFAALAEALELYVDADAGARMRQPWALADSRQVLELLADAGLCDVDISQHTRVARFIPRHDFARRLVSATPLAHTFATAEGEQQRRILGHVEEAIHDCDGGANAVCFPLTTNIALARVGTDAR